MKWNLFSIPKLEARNNIMEKEKEQTLKGEAEGKFKLCFSPNPPLLLQMESCRPTLKVTSSSEI